MYTKAKIAVIEKREKCRYTPLIMRLTGLGSDVLHIKRLKFDHYWQISCLYLKRSGGHTFFLVVRCSKCEELHGKP